VPSWIKAAVPMLATGLQEYAVQNWAKDDPAKAESLRRSFGAFANMFSGSVPPMPVQSAATAGAEGTTFMFPKTIREVLAFLDDEEAIALGQVLADLDEVELPVVLREAKEIADVEARVAWARRLLNSEAEPDDAPPATTATMPTVPPQLVAVLAQLSPDEHALGMQILSSLDRATTEKVTAAMAALTPNAALAKIRAILDEAHHRAASVAHRAVASAFAGPTNGPSHDGGAA
jgi:hypothetical protein